jgi:hypothetical protein
MNSSLNNVQPSSFRIAANAAAVVVVEHVLLLRIRKKRRLMKQRRWNCRIRQRRSVLEIFDQLGDPYFRRAYRMSYSSFGHLARMLSEGIGSYWLLSRRKNPRWSRIMSAMAELCQKFVLRALRWFAGGSAYDIMTTFGISHSEVSTSAWFVVQAVNTLQEFDIVYPANHNKHREIADGFFEISAADLGCCAGAIDGILV